VTELAGDGARVSSARIWSHGADGGELAVKTYVVCTGGLENSRLLLWSNMKSGNGVVPEPAALGRYWMEHPQFEGGDAILFDSSLFEHDAVGEAFFSPTAKAMNERQIMNFGIRLIERPYHGAKALVADLACRAPETAEWVARGFGQHLRCAAQLYVGWEQSPVFENHVALHDTQKDAAGVPRIDLHWKKGELERRTLLEGLKLFGETLISKDLGRVRIEDWVSSGADYPNDQELAGHHHMGGTRMGTDPKTSVVDRNCKVHGMDNLYVGGSSVFATSGQCNPTTTIVALSLRLGEHLGAKLRA
jgi:GMC oxidoreductase